MCARWIHDCDMRLRERFINVNCAVLPDGLLDGELLGHEKGFFTGATD